jgi:hypothetical protein
LAALKVSNPPVDGMRTGPYAALSNSCDISTGKLMGLEAVGTFLRFTL